MRVLGVIPARGGSKGIHRKNIALLCGRPLLAYTAEAALAAKRLDRVILSTDDREIAAVGSGFGLEVPFLRPAELACDDTPTLPVLRHAARWAAEHDAPYDAICLLQPTNPLRGAATIDACIDLLETSGADAAATVLRVPDEFHPHWTYLIEGDGSLRLFGGADAPVARRQDLPPAFHREGSVYVTRWHVLTSRNSLYGARFVGLELDRAESVNLDGPADWTRAEELLSRRNGPLAAARFAASQAKLPSADHAG